MGVLTAGLVYFALVIYSVCPILLGQVEVKHGKLANLQNTQIGASKTFFQTTMVTLYREGLKNGSLLQFNINIVLSTTDIRTVA